MNAVPAIRRLLLPVFVFAAVALAHYVWLGVFPERNPAQARWETVAAPESAFWFSRYVKTQSYWLGYSYALSLAFAAVALRRYREHRMCAARNLAIGGVTLSGLLAVTGCFLVGCCGSPMLGVYLSLFGATFLPLAKPFVAGLTTLMIVLSYWWMRRHNRADTHSTNPVTRAAGKTCDCNSPDGVTESR